MTGQLAGCCRNVDRAVGRVADDADCQVAQGRKDARESPGTYLGEVFTEGHISDPVEAILYGPLSVNEPEQVLDGCVVEREVRDVETGLDADPDVIEGRGLSLDDDEGPRVREGDRRRDRC